MRPQLLAVCLIILSDPSSVFQRKIREAEATQPAEMTVSQLDEWLSGNLKEAFPKASDMELADLRIPCESLPLLSTGAVH